MINDLSARLHTVKICTEEYVARNKDVGSSWWKTLANQSPTKSGVLREESQGKYREKKYFG